MLSARCGGMHGFREACLDRADSEWDRSVELLLFPRSLGVMPHEETELLEALSLFPCRHGRPQFTQMVL